MAYKYDVDFFVVALQEQVQKDKEPLGQVLDFLCHGPGYIHQTKHHRACRGYRLLDEVVISEVEIVEKRNLIQAPLQPLQLGFYFSDAVFGPCLQGDRFEFFVQCLYLAPDGAAERDAPGVCAA